MQNNTGMTTEQIVDSYILKKQKEKERAQYIASLQYEKAKEELALLSSRITSILNIAEKFDENYLKFPRKGYGIEITRSGGTQVFRTKVKGYYFYITDGTEIVCSQIANLDIYNELQYHAAVKFINGFKKYERKVLSFVHSLDLREPDSPAEKNEMLIQNLPEMNYTDGDNQITYIKTPQSVFVCMDTGDVSKKKNKDAVLKINDSIIQNGNFPLIYQLFFQQLKLNSENEDTKSAFIKKLIRCADSFLIVGEEISAQMRKEINYALEIKIPIFKMPKIQSQ